METERTSRCLVRITSGGDGWSYEGSSKGSLRTDGREAELTYSVDGDRCTLTVRDGRIVQRRFGAQPLELVFAEGRTTQCSLGAGGLSGSFAILTHRAEVSLGAGKMEVNLEYDNGGLTRLRLTAEEEQ